MQTGPQMRISFHHHPPQEATMRVLCRYVELHPGLYQMLGFPMRRLTRRGRQSRNSQRGRQKCGVRGGLLKDLPLKRAKVGRVLGGLASRENADDFRDTDRAAKVGGRITDWGLEQGGRPRKNPLHHLTSKEGSTVFDRTIGSHCTRIDARRDWGGRGRTSGQDRSKHRGSSRCVRQNNRNFF